MAVVPKNFGGKLIYRPGAYVRALFPIAAGGGGVSTTEVIVVGEARGGVPWNASGVPDNEKVNVFLTEDQIVDVLRNGDGMYMCQKYLNPTKREDIQKPTQVKFIGVNPSSPSALVLQESAVDKIDLDSARYGSLANQLSTKVEAGTNIGHKITVKFETTEIATQDDIGYESFEIQYTGAGSAATMTINGTALTTTVTAGPGGEDLNLTFADFPRLDRLVDYINEQPAYTCTILGRPDFATDTLDAATAVDIRTAAYQHDTIIQAVIDFFNNDTDNEINAALSSGATRTAIDNTANFVFFSGGSNGTTTNNDWIGAADLLKKIEGVNHILLATGDPAIHAIFETHVREMSKTGVRKRRTLGTGGSFGKTDATMIAEMRVLNSARTEYWATQMKFQDVNDGNQVKEFAPFYGAAMGAGIRYGAGGKDAHCVLKEINIQGVSKIYNETEHNALLAVGASLLFQDGSTFKVMANPTTLQDTSANKILHHPSGITTTDFIDNFSERVLQDRISAIVGAGSEPIINEFVNFMVTDMLPRLRDQERVLTDFGSQKAFDPDGVKFQVSGDGFLYKFNGTVPLPIIYVFGEHTYRPVESGSFTFGAAA